MRRQLLQGKLPLSRSAMHCIHRCTCKQCVAGCKLRYPQTAIPFIFIVAVPDTSMDVSRHAAHHVRNATMSVLPQQRPESQVQVKKQQQQLFLLKLKISTKQKKVSSQCEHLHLAMLWGDVPAWRVKVTRSGCPIANFEAAISSPVH